MDLNIQEDFQICISTFKDVSFLNLNIKGNRKLSTRKNQYTLFLDVSNVFFSTQPQYCLTFSWIELQMLLRRCLTHRTIIILRHILHLVYLCTCRIYVIDFSLTSFKQTYLTFALLFFKFQPGVAYKSVAYKKKNLTHFQTS